MADEKDRAETRTEHDLLGDLAVPAQAYSNDTDHLRQVVEHSIGLVTALSPAPNPDVLES